MLLLTHEVEEIKAGDDIFVVDQSKCVSSKDSAELVELSGRGDASEFFHDSLLNLVAHRYFVLDELGCENG